MSVGEFDAVSQTLEPLLRKQSSLYLTTPTDQPYMAICRLEHCCFL